MTPKIIKIVTNWRFNPPFDGYDGYVISDDYEIGVKDVVKIIQHEPKKGLQMWNFVVVYEDGTSERVFNINQVVYSNS